MKNSVLLQLLLVFTPMSFLTIGGGMSIVADMQHQSVDVYHWLTQDQFVDDYAISRAAPGPNTQLVTLVGWQAAGLPGALVASLAIYLPAAFLFYGLTVLWRRHAFSKWRDKLARGLAPVSIGLVTASSYSILMANSTSLLSWAVTAASLAALVFTKINPIALLAGGAAAFLVRALAGS